MGTETDTGGAGAEGKPRKDTARRWPSTSQGDHTCQHLGLGLPASRTERRRMPVAPAAHLPSLFSSPSSEEAASGKKSLRRTAPFEERTRDTHLLTQELTRAPPPRVPLQSTRSCAHCPLRSLRNGPARERPLLSEAQARPPPPPPPPSPLSLPLLPSPSSLLAPLCHPSQLRF